MRPFIFPGLALLGSGLAACGGGGLTDPVRCPATTVLDGASGVIRLAPGSQQVSHEVQITGATANCGMEEGRGQVDSTLKFLVTRGPGGQDGPVRFTYFVAISDPSSRILARRAFDVVVERGGEQTITEELAQTIPVAPRARLEDYRIFVGLQLTAEELERNRQLLGR